MTEAVEVPVPSLSACWEAVGAKDAPFTAWQTLVDVADRSVCPLFHVK